jgi:hypothetical protein
MGFVLTNPRMLWATSWPLTGALLQPRCNYRPRSHEWNTSQLIMTKCYAYDMHEKDRDHIFTYDAPQK